MGLWPSRACLLLSHPSTPRAPPPAGVCKSGTPRQLGASGVEGPTFFSRVFGRTFAVSWRGLGLPRFSACPSLFPPLSYLRRHKRPEEPYDCQVLSESPVRAPKRGPSPFRLPHPRCTCAGPANGWGAGAGSARGLRVGGTGKMESLCGKRQFAEAGAIVSGLVFVFSWSFPDLSGENLRRVPPIGRVGRLGSTATKLRIGPKGAIPWRWLRTILILQGLLR